MEPQNLIDKLKEDFPEGKIEVLSENADLVLSIGREFLHSLMSFLKEGPSAFTLLLDLTCVDYCQARGIFEMVYHVYSLTEKRRLRIKIGLPADDLFIDSLASFWKNAEWLEREVYDMFGIVFKGHPGLKRILMYEGFEGYPLRKDYPWRRRQPKAAPGVRPDD